MEALLLLPSLILGFLLWQEKTHRAEAEKAWRLERVGLLNRIQAPQAAAYEPTEASEEPAYIPFDSDAAWDDYMERRASGELI